MAVNLLNKTEMKLANAGPAILTNLDDIPYVTTVFLVSHYN